ncbi:S8 family serine peptidase [Amycolatopsis suaedae]|uniref:Trypsin-like serine protease n=1 Tax=Amycolatopsis suaedae TaxID=2510978 RepID=A0A4Q7J2F9_9PSEU|nr:S8 family serine peptidase [Amycolatopsis suaedae]RZQ60134.1 trypsin-like serine protease [Amycolatopsis suaedae]
MSRRKRALGAAVAAVAVTALAAPTAAAQAPSGYIVLLDGAVSAAAGTLAERYGADLGHTYDTAVRGFSATMTESQARRMAADPAVALVERDGIATGVDTQTDPTWGLDRVDQRDLPLDRRYSYAGKGEGTTVYVVDSGVDYRQSEFGGRASSGYDFIDNDGDAADCAGHGTHVAGTVASNTYGVAKGSRVVSVRVLGCNNSGAWSGIIRGIDWVAKNARKPAVITLSLGGGATSSVDQAVQGAVRAGVTATVAAGNNGQDACNYSPARTPEAITVAASDERDRRSVFSGFQSSNFGRCTDIFAPGSNITSLRNGGGTTRMNGTSMATPHVAGAAAIYLGANPSASPSQVTSALTGSATSGKITDGRGSPNKLLYTGSLAQRAVAPTDEARLPGDVRPASIGGEPASVRDHPFVIAALREGGSRPRGQSCSGSVIAPRKVLVAAHCKELQGRKTVLYGLDDLAAPGGTQLNVVDYKTHPRYVHFAQGYDVAVITTDADIPVPAGGYAKVATSADTGLESPGRDGYSLGYGKKSHSDSPPDVTLHKLTLPIVDHRQCTGVENGADPKTMICAGYPDGRKTVLPGDSGGPFIVDGKVAGVASWSRSDFRWYSIYSRLNNEMGDWVNEQIGGQPPTGRFSLGATPASVRVEPGKHVSASITSKAGDGGAEKVTLTASGLPGGATATFQPSTINSGEVAKLTIETATSTPEGEYRITVSGKGNTDTATTTLMLTVGKGSQPGDLVVKVDPAAGSARPGALVSATVTATGGTGSIRLSASGNGLPIPPMFNPQTIAAGGSSTMQVFAPFQAGTYPITVTAADAAGKTVTATYTLTVQ